MGYFMKNCGLLILITLLNITLWGLQIDIPDNAQNKLVEYEQIDEGNIHLEFNLDKYEREELTRAEVTYTKISNPEAGSLLDIGMPDLPVFTRLVAIPDEGNPLLTITSLNSHTIKNIMIYPQEEILTETETERDVFTIDSEYYQQGGIYPAAAAVLGEPAIMRDIRLVKVTFNPFQYNAAARELVIHDNICAELTISGSGGINVKTGNRPPSRVFDNLYASSVLNHAETTNLRTDFQRPAILFIYPQNNNVENNLQYLMDWKNKKGFDVTSASTSQTGTTSAMIKNYIQNAYDNWENPPDYVVLVGDVSGTILLPSWYESWSGTQGIGDHPYAQLEGNDVLADIILGRISVNNINELQTVIAKSINYEREPYMDNTQWFENAILFAYGGPGKIATCETVEGYISIHNNDFSFTEIYYSNWVYALDQALNTGASYLCWRSQGVDCDWNNNNIYALNNGWMLPYGVLCTCFTADIYGSSLSEAFVKAGTSTIPKGGIAAVGTSTGMTSGCFNNCITNGVFYGIFIDNIYTTGGALVRGKLNLYQQYPSNPSNHVNCWSHCNNLMGDPSIELWTGIPQPMLVNIPDEVAFGTNFMEINLTDEAGVPLENGWVTARGDNDYYQTGYTDMQGKYYLDISGTEMNQTFEITITSHNKIPYENEINVIQAEYLLDIAQVNFLDSQGDGIPNPGEEITLELTIANDGSSDLTGISAELVSLNDNVSVVISNTDLGDLNSGSQLVNSDLAIYLDSATPGGSRVQLQLILTSDGEIYVIPLFIDISGATLYIASYVAQDSNGILDPGESADIYFMIENLGAIAATSIYGELACFNSRISIQDSTGFFGDIAPGGTAYNFSDTFEITADSNIIPGTQIPVTITFTNLNGYNETCSYLIEIGTVTEEDPLGPDEYGYYCYDDGDTAYDECPVYDWIEIHSIGDNLGLYTPGDEADIEDVELPADFSFVFYGLEYDMITVASAGWICPGGTDAAEFMNWTLPGAGGASPMIAAFWDDIHNGYNGGVYTYYDAAQHYFIIEWDHMQNEHNNEEETFQILLYDPDYYPTTTGDSKIKIQYKAFTNANIGEYPYHGADHGLYCTVGLEDHTATRGLLYTYNNTYPTAAKPITSESALLFTVSPVPQDGPFLNIVDYEAYAGGDCFIEAGEEAMISIVLQNLGAESANDVQVILSGDDQYIDILNDTANCDLVLANSMVTIPNAFLISVSENVPDFYSFSLNVNISSNEEAWNQLIILTAYELNTFTVDPAVINYEMIWGNSDSTSFELANIGDIPINFYIRTDETSTSRDVMGSFLECDATGFTPGQSTYWTFTVHNGAIDNEWISDVWIDFPLGVTLIEAGDFVGGSGGNMFWDETTGQGANVNWHGTTVSDWGVLHYGEVASATMFVNLSTEFAGDLTINYSIGGDGYGNEPHVINGEIILEYPLRWINLNMSSGTIPPGQSQEICVDFDTADIEETVHTCNIVITSDSWDTKTIPVTLIPVAQGNDPESIPASNILSQNYPNPFNPRTIIPFSICESAANVTLKIYNLKGQAIRTLLNAPTEPGNFTLYWDGKDDNGKDVASGIYFSNLSVDGEKQTRKMVMIK
ncbi:MAG: T9SS type A sorting domain-containing protein [Candidatus Cloacimonetes bacterium]|nr:T9SS type A sorting domain-containing protein [Candidatus Cloacimonadota bacterium]